VLAIDNDTISWSDRSILIHGKDDRLREMFFSRAVWTLLFVDVSHIQADSVSSSLIPKRL